MHRNEEGALDEEDEFGVPRSGRRYKTMKIGVEKGEPHNKLEGREPCTIIQII
jgi:hypothetical protein